MASFPSINLCGQATNEGRLEVSPDVITWHSKAGDRSVSVDTAAHSGGTAPTFAWYDFGRSCQLWVQADDGELYRFDGFRLADLERVSAALGGKRVEKRSLAAKGANWGGIRVRGKNLEIVDGDGKLVVPLPMSGISQAALPGRGEVELQFYDVDTLEREDEACVELRLYVPEEHELPDDDLERAKDLVVARAKAKAAAAKETLTEDDMTELETSAKDPSTAIHALITDAAGIAGVSGEAIAELGEDVGQFLVPRGRFAMELYPGVLRLIGKTYEFKIAYKSIARMFYLPKPTPGAVKGEEGRCFFVISLDDPIRHGAQRHPHLVMQIERTHIEVPLNISDEDVAAGRYDGLGKDARVLGGDAPKVVAQLLKHISGKPIYKPGGFISAGGTQAVRASCKGNDGYLYPLDKSFLFVHKPATYIRYAEVDSVGFRRDEGGIGRTWDLEVAVKGVGGEAAHTVLFQGIDKSEREPLRAFLQTRSDLRIVESTKPSATSAIAAAMASDEEEEEADGGAAPGKRRRPAGDDISLPSEDEEDDEDFGSAEEEEDEDEDEDEDEEDEDSDAGFRKKKGKGSKKKPKAAAKPSKKDKKKPRKSKRGSDDD